MLNLNFPNHMLATVSYLPLQVLDEKQHQMAAENEYNFDHPDAFDFDLLKQTLMRLKSGKKVEVPIYNFITHSREEQSVSLFCRLQYFHNLKIDYCKRGNFRWEIIFVKMLARHFTWG